MKRSTVWKAIFAFVFLALGFGIYRQNQGETPYRVDPLKPNAGSLVVDERFELAQRYAPVIYHEFDERRGRQDVPAPVDFDGDLVGDDNWEEFPFYELIPTVYYAVLETETHWFLTFHIFHPRDWTWIDLGLHMTHENDGENLQVVVDKATEKPVLLFTQAHYRGVVYTTDDSGFGNGSQRLRGSILLLDDDAAPDPDGMRVGVYVESGGHGIYGALDNNALVSIDEDGTGRFRSAGWVLRPALDGAVPVEPALETGAVFSYQLESITAKLWPLLARGELCGSGALLDGEYDYGDRRVSIGVPRYYEADRFSGPFGPDRGISPFALDFDFREGTLGALFFAPAERYAECLQVPTPWSVEYVSYPYRTDGQ